MKQNHLYAAPSPAYQHPCTDTDSRETVFDVRPSGASFYGQTIERVNVHTGDVEVIYRAVRGRACRRGDGASCQTTTICVLFMALKTLMRRGITIFTTAGALYWRPEDWLTSMRWILLRRTPRRAARTAVTSMCLANGGW